MTNTLTWNIKPIQLPKVNTNLLSVVSLVLLLTMVFLTGSVIADHCGKYQALVWVAEGVLISVTIGWFFAKNALKVAILTFNPVKIAAAAALLAGAKLAVIGAGAAVFTAQEALEDCEKQHQSASAGSGSGGCDSGGCGSGSCDIVEG